MKKVRLLTILMSALATALALQGIMRLVELTRPLTLPSVLPRGVVSPAERSLRPIYPYSVIPGGAYTAVELRRAVSKDPVVRTHYSSFDLKTARLVTLAVDRFQYVSFRIGDNIYWTRRKIRISQGEILLTDGQHFARTRCGNRLCDIPQLPVTSELTSYKSLSLPPFTPELLANEEISLPPAPTIAESRTEALEFERPLLAPYLPPVPPMTTVPLDIGRPMNVLQSSAVGAPNDPSLSLPPVKTVSLQSPSTLVAEVPEPGSIYLFFAAFAVSLGVIIRWIRRPG